MLQDVHRVLDRLPLAQAGLKANEANSGAVTLIQSFGSAANLNNLLHRLMLDGVYKCGDAGPIFGEMAPVPLHMLTSSRLVPARVRLFGELLIECLPTNSGSWLNPGD